MKHITGFMLATLMLVGFIGWLGQETAVAAQPPHTIIGGSLPSPVGHSFIHIARPENTLADLTLIDHPLTNNNPNAHLLVTSHWLREGDFGVFNNNEVGLFYNNAHGKWGVYNESTNPMPSGAAFNIFVADSPTISVQHTSSPENINLNWTLIDDPDLNNQPNLILFANHHFQSERHPHVTGVWYSGQWSIFNQDQMSMVADRTFNIVAASEQNNVFVHVADADNINAYWTYIDHPLLNSNPDAIIFVSQIWNPFGAVEGVYNDNPITVWYDPDPEQWAIMNQSLADIPLDAKFSVMLPGQLFHLYLPLITYN
jgi:hypothetical protein